MMRIYLKNSRAKLSRSNLKQWNHGLGRPNNNWTTTIWTKYLGLTNSLIGLFSASHWTIDALAHVTWLGLTKTELWVQFSDLKPCFKCFAETKLHKNIFTVVYNEARLYCNHVRSSLCAWCCRILLFEEKSKQEKNKATGPAPKRTMEELLAKWRVGIKLAPVMYRPNKSWTVKTMWTHY